MIYPLFFAEDSYLYLMQRFKPWLKRIGIAGFLFFLIKGLIWLAVLIGVGKCAS